MIRKKSFALSLALHVSVLAGVFLWMSHRKEPIKATKPTLIKLAMLQTPQTQKEQAKEVPKAKMQKPFQEQVVRPPKPTLAPNPLVKTTTTQKTSTLPMEPPEPKPQAMPSVKKQEVAQEMPKVEQKVVSKPQPLTPAVDTKGIQNAYLSYIHQSANHLKTYPKNARRLSQEGVAYVHFVIQSDGTISNITLQKSSGFSLLDAAALQLIASLKTLKPIPEELAKERYDLVLPVDYKLQ